MKAVIAIFSLFMVLVVGCSTEKVKDKDSNKKSAAISDEKLDVAEDTESSDDIELEDVGSEDDELSDIYVTDTDGFKYWLGAEEIVDGYDWNTLDQVDKIAIVDYTLDRVKHIEAFKETRSSDQIALLVDLFYSEEDKLDEKIAASIGALLVVDATQKNQDNQ